MRYKKSIIILMLSVFLLLSITSVCAADVNDTAIIGEDTTQQNHEIIQETSASDNQPLIASGNDAVEIDDSNYNEYFDENGLIIDNGKISDNDKLILGNINNKIFNINKNLQITSNNETINDIVFIFSEGSANSIVENLNIKCEDSHNSAFNVRTSDITIQNNVIEVIGAEDASDIYAIHADSADRLNIKSNSIIYHGQSNGTAGNGALYVSNSANVNVFGNTFDISIPYWRVNLTWGVLPNAVGVKFSSCPGLTLKENKMVVVCEDFVVSDYDGAYSDALAICIEQSDEVIVERNEVNINSYLPKAYALSIQGNNFQISSNVFDITSDENNVMGVDVEGESSGKIDGNRFSLNSPNVAYGIHAFDNNMDSQTLICTNNDIHAESYAIYGIELLYLKESTISGNNIELMGNYALGIAEYTITGQAIITNNIINVYGTDKDRADTGDMIPAMTVGIFSMGESQIRKNVIASTGNWTIYNSGDGAYIIDNYLVSSELLGDASVYDEAGSITVQNNIPITGATNYDLYNDTFYLFFDDEGVLRDNITSQSLTFHGSFSNLADKITINRPISLIGDGAVLNDIQIDILSSDVSVSGFSFVTAKSCIYIDCADNVELSNNDFEVKSESGDSIIVIDIYESNDLRIIENSILLEVNTNETVPNRVINAKYCEDMLISENNIYAYLPARSIDWSTGVVYSEGVLLDECKNAFLTQNIVAVASAGSIGEYDTIYGVHITGENIRVYDNAIVVIESPFSYSLVLSAEDFDVCANIIFAGSDFSEIMGIDDFDFFNTQIYSNMNASELFENLTRYAESKDIKNYLNNLNSKNLTSYACAIEVDGPSNGKIDFNMIGTAAVSSYGIYTANWAGDVKLRSALNLIVGYGNSAFGMSFSASQASAEYGLIFMMGNFTTGIASAARNININHVGIEALGSNEGIPLGYDSMGIETTGVHIVDGQASLSNNIINTSGEFAVDFKGEGNVIDNYLVARQYTGDASVDCDSEDVIIRGNVPIFDKIKTQITANPVTTTYNVNKELVITLTDNNSKPISGVKLTVDLNGVKVYTTDADGRVKISTGALTPKSYAAKISFNGNRWYEDSNATVSVVINKVASKIIAKKKIKVKSKSRKFTITLKDSTGKAIGNAKVKLTVKKMKKNPVKKTNAKGKVTFKLKKLKKGKYKATVKFAGNEYYTGVAKKIKIIIK